MPGRLRIISILPPENREPLTSHIASVKNLICIVAVGVGFLALQDDPVGLSTSGRLYFPLKLYETLVFENRIANIALAP